MMDESAPDQLVRDTLQALGRIDILINSAGGATVMDIDTPEQKWAEATTLNYTRVRQLTLAVLPGMIQHKWGRIINISGKSEPAGLTSATAAKAAVHGFAKGLSRVVGKHGITVNSIPPGRIMSEQILRNYTEEFRARQAAEDIPLGRYGEPDELADLAVFLASPRAGYITGAVLPVDGGLRRYAF
jgi:3-oxoacyl-[acyl-carrier protein] reductase